MNEELTVGREAADSRQHDPQTVPLPQTEEAAAKHEEATRPPLLVDEVDSAFAEAFRILSQSVEHLAFEKEIKSVLAMSPFPGDGRTTLVANLGLALAQQKHRVILVEADGRSPSLTHLAEAGNGEFDSPTPQTWNNNGWVLKQWTGLPLYVLTAKDDEPVPLESVSRLMESLRERFDFILLDPPPWHGRADVFRIAESVEAAIFVIRRRPQDIDTLRKAKGQLETLGVTILGTVYNEA